MAFQTVEAQRLSGLKPLDGVFKLEDALQQIDEHLNNTTASSPSYVELQSLKQSYTQYLEEAKQLRQKGMTSFRKYLKMKNNTNTMEPMDQTQINTNNVPHQTQDIEDINNAQNVNTIDDDMLNHAQSISNEYIHVTEEDPQTASAITTNSNDDDDHINLMEENTKLREEIEALMKNKVDHEETEHELRLILEEYKFTQLSHKQEINNLKSTVSAYKKASNTKTQSLDTLSNEYETIKNNNNLITKQNTSLKQQITQYLNDNTNLKEKLIESKAQCDALIRANNELKEKFALSQQLNAPHTVVMDNIDAPVVPKHEHTEGDTEIEERLQRVYNMVKHGEHNDIKHELEVIMEAFHPIKIKKQPVLDIKSNDVEGNYVITKEEYADIEKVIDDRDQYLNKVMVYEQNMKILNDKYCDTEKRLKEITEEKSLMMSTLKESVESLAKENSSLRNNMENLNHERSSIKEHELKTQNDFYKVYEENRERKFEMNGMGQKIHELNRDIETYKYLSQQLKDNNAKLNIDLTNSLERIDRLIQDKEIISKKLRESDKLAQEIMKEYNKPKTDKTESKDNDVDINDLRNKYNNLLREKGNVERMFHENEGTVNELTNQIIELENRLRNIELENELLKKEIKQITEDNNRKTNQIKSAQRVALSIIQSNKDGMSSNNNRDMFGLQPPPEPDLITSLLTYLLPFLFEDDDQPKIV